MLPQGVGFLTEFDYIISYTVISYLICMLANNVPMGGAFSLFLHQSVPIPTYIPGGGGEGCI